MPFRLADPESYRGPMSDEDLSAYEAELEHVRRRALSGQRGTYQLPEEDARWNDQHRRQASLHAAGLPTTDLTRLRTSLQNELNKLLGQIAAGIIKNEGQSKAEFHRQLLKTALYLRENDTVIFQPPLLRRIFERPLPSEVAVEQALLYGKFLNGYFLEFLASRTSIDGPRDSSDYMQPNFIRMIRERAWDYLVTMGLWSENRKAILEILDREAYQRGLR